MADAISIKSEQDIEIYNDEFNFKVFAGPGAGKTYFIIENIKVIISKSQKLKIDENRRIACITYTNVAVDEIKRRLESYGKYVHVSTIHSFLNEFVITPYIEQLKILLKDMFGIIIPPKTKITVRKEGFSLLDKEQVEKLLGLLKEGNLALYEKLSNKNTSKKVSFFDKFKLNIKGINLDVENIKLSYDKVSYWGDAEIAFIKNKILESTGVLDYEDILLFSYLLIKNFKQIQYSIRYIFPYILIDEFQDTTKIQNKIIQIIGNSKTVSIGVIGDCAQAIYGFAGSNYNDFLNFKLPSKEMKEYVIDGNRRSKQNIVYFLNYIRQKDKHLCKQYCIGDNKEGGEVVFLLSEDENINVNEYLPTNTISICRRWTDTFLTVSDIPKEELEALKEIYNTNRFAFGNDTSSMFIEDAPGWVSQIKFITSIKEKIKNKNFSSIIKECSKIFLLDDFQNPQKNQLRNYLELKKFISLVDKINEKDNYYNICKYTNECAKEIQLPIKNFFETFEGDNANDYNENYILLLSNLNLLTYPTLMKIANEVFVEDSKHVTIHRVKGKEFENVLVKYETADFVNDELLNLLYAPDLFQDLGLNNLPKNSENPRIAYVGFSRAINGLFIQLRTNIAKFKEIEKKFDVYMKENNIKNTFYMVIDLNNKKK